MNDVSVKLVELLRQKGLTISTAESCTGGLVAKTLTDVSGASAVFWGGVVSYDNSVKQNVLGVKKETLDSVGAVSHDTACQMAKGVQRVINTNIGISTTGIAGPTGGTAEKPIGTVYVGIAYGEAVEGYLLSIDPCLSRDEIRQEAVKRVLTIAYEKILENY